MIRAEYDPREALAMVQKLKQINQNDPGKVGMLFSSHPPTSERIENVRPRDRADAVAGEALSEFEAVPGGSGRLR